MHSALDQGQGLASAQVDVLFVERHAALGLLRLTHDLDLGTLGAHVVEEELGTRGPLVVYPGADSNDLVLVILTRLEVTKVLDEVPDIVVNYGNVMLAPPSRKLEERKKGTCKPHREICGGRGWAASSPVTCGHQSRQNITMKEPDMGNGKGKRTC